MNTRNLPQPAVRNDPDQALALLGDTTLSLPSSIRGRCQIPTSGADWWSITGRLTDAERGELVRTEKRLEVVLTAGEAGEIKQYVIGMLLAFPAAGMSAQVAEARVQMYTTALLGLPMWAVRRAVERFIRGEIERETHAFAPSPPEIAKEALALLRPYRMFKWEIGKVLAADVEPTPAEREAMRARFAPLARFRPTTEAAE
jgi:hypothetical protein